MSGGSQVFAAAALSLTAAIPSCFGQDADLNAEIHVDFAPNFVPLKFTWYPQSNELSVSISSSQWVTPIGVVSAGVVISPSSDDGRVVQVHADGHVYAIEANTRGADIVVESACPGVQTTSSSGGATTIVELSSRTTPCRFIAYTSESDLRDPLMLGRYQVAQCDGYLAQVGSVNASTDHARAEVQRLLSRFPEAEYQSNDLCIAMTAGRYSVGVWAASPERACAVREDLVDVAIRANPSLPDQQKPTVRDLSSDTWLYSLCGS